MMNSYTINVFEKENKPCFVVTINHIMKSGVYFFNTIEETNKYLYQTIRSLDHFAYLAYDENGCNDEKTLEMIKYVLNNDDIVIGTNGKTYSKTIFPNGI